MSERQKLLDLLGQRGLWPDKARQMVDDLLYEFAHAAAEEIRTESRSDKGRRAEGMLYAADLIDPEVL